MSTHNIGFMSWHGRLWYDDPWYRSAWIVLPQALGLLLISTFFLSQASNTKAPWGKPIDPQAHIKDLIAKRNEAETNKDAMAGLEQLAMTGDGWAAFYAGTLYDPSLKLSKIISPDAHRTIEFYNLAADKNIGMAQNNLAGLYLTGQFLPPDPAISCSLAIKAGHAATSPVMTHQGDCYAHGLGNTPVDLPKAIKAYETASNMGFARASTELGYFYEKGEGGLEKNTETALKLYRQAADKGDLLALHNLGVIYNAGLIVPKDPHEAARLIFTALDHKSDLTLKNLTGHPENWSGGFWLDLQHRLTERGFYKGPFDGNPTPETLDAVRHLAAKS